MSKERKKAEALVEMFQTETPPTMECMPIKAAIQCAKLCVKEILSAVTTIADKKYDFYNLVLTELNKM